MAGFLDTLESIAGSKALGEVGDYSGMIGSTLGLAGGFTKDDKHAGNLGIAAGSFNTLSGAAGLLGEWKKYKDNKGSTGDSSKKNSSIFGMLSNGLGTLGGITDIVGGVMQKNGDEKGKQVTGLLSGSLGTLGGLASIGKGFFDLKGAENAEDKRAAWNTMITGGLTGLGSIFGMVGTQEAYKASQMAEGTEEEKKKKESAANTADKWSMAGNIIGNGGGLLGGIFGKANDYGLIGSIMSKFGK